MLNNFTAFEISKTEIKSTNSTAHQSNTTEETGYILLHALLLLLQRRRVKNCDPIFAPRSPGSTTSRLKGRESMTATIKDNTSNLFQPW